LTAIYTPLSHGLSTGSTLLLCPQIAQLTAQILDLITELSQLGVVRVTAAAHQT